MIRSRVFVWWVGLFIGLCLFAAPAGAVYVAASGDNSDGTSWDTAYTDLQTAITACAGQVSVIYIKAGLYSNNTPVLIATQTAAYTNSACFAVSNHPGLTLRGGFAGNTEGGLPGTMDSEPTVLTVGALTTRVFYAVNSTVTLDRVTISNGLALVWSDSYRSGSGLYLSNCVALVTNCLFTRNSDKGGGVAPVYGGGIYVRNGRLTMADSTVVSNGYWVYRSGDQGRGGGMYALDTVVTLNNVVFDRNVMAGYNDTAGGAFFALRGTHTVARCLFDANRCSDANGRASVVSLDSVGVATFSECVFNGNTLSSYYNPAVLDMAGTATPAMQFDTCVLRGNRLAAGAGGGLISAVRMRSTGGSVSFRDCVIEGNDGSGVYRLSGTTPIALTNCLIANNAMDGLRLDTAGNVSVAHCTVANNVGGWGVTNGSSGTITIRDSIFWGNGMGSCTGNTLVVTYTSLQEPRAGSGTVVTNPLFIAGYYLSKAGLPSQSQNSPCLDIGSDTADTLGMNTRATTTDNAVDDGPVDLGYHFTNGIADSAFSNLVLYVDANNGNDMGDGWTPETALKTISNAFTRAMDGTRINVAAGTYTTNTEALPLVIPYGNMSLVGTNRALTVLDGKATYRVIYASNKTGLHFEGLTISNGWSASAIDGHYGGDGFYLRGCQSVITNCVVVRNGFGSAVPVYGAGVYASGGNLTVVDSVLRTNGVSTYYGATLGLGGGLCALNGAVVTLDNVLFDRNILNGYDYTYGGALYMKSGVLRMRHCQFTGNYLWTYYGTGIVDLESLASVTVSNCVFQRNFCYGHNPGGNILTLFGAGSSGYRVTDCLVVSNTAGFSAGHGGMMAAGMWAGFAGGSVSIERCDIGSNTCSGITKSGTGVMGVTNCLIYAHTTNGIRVAAGSVNIRNSTMATNAGWGVTNAGGTVTIKNSIIWDNILGGIGGAATVNYSDIQGGYVGTANRWIDPKFVNAAARDFHEKSTAGSWHNDTGTFVADGEDSPCLDTGDPADSIGDEPTDNGNTTINMGRYGGTAQASKTSLAGVPPYMDNATGGATGIVDTAAWLNGTLTSTGTASTVVWVFWDTINRGTNKTWTGSYDFGGVPRTQGDYLSYQALGLTPNTWYWYTYYASNQSGDAWGEPTQRTFKTYGPPAVNNNPGATWIGMSVATLNGTLTNGVSANVSIYWWSDNAPVTNVLTLGAARTEGAFSTTIAGLLPGTHYWYRCWASNIYGTAWADSATSFTTKGPVFVYASPAGAGAKDGSDWDNAFDNIQSAVDACYGTYGTIYLKAGVFSNSPAVNLSNVITVVDTPSLTLRGGYLGNAEGGLPGTLGLDPSIVTRAAGTSNRLLYAVACTMTVDTVTFSNGLATTALAGHYGGAGLCLVRCTTVITNCVVTRNAANQQPINGLAMYVSSGRVDIADTLFRTNAPTFTSGSTLGSGSGGLGIFHNATATLNRVRFEYNVADGYDNTYGGTFYMSGGSLTMRGCSFLGNYMRTFYGRGLVELDSLTSLFISSNLFVRNVANGYSGNNILCVRGTGTAGMRIEECAIVSNTALFSSSYGTMAAGLLAGIAGGSLNIQRCLIGSNACSGLGKEGTGTAGITNCLVYGNATNGIRREGAGALSIGSSTIATNAAWGITNAAAGSLTVINSIIWDNRLGGLGGVTTVSYSDIQGGYAGTANFALDPRFAGAGGADHFFALNNGSPCINTGFDEPWMGTGKDLAGRRRKMVIVDRGCYETPIGAGALITLY